MYRDKISYFELLNLVKDHKAPDIIESDNEKFVFTNQCYASNHSTLANTLVKNMKNPEDSFLNDHCLCDGTIYVTNDEESEVIKKSLKQFYSLDDILYIQITSNTYKLERTLHLWLKEEDSIDGWEISNSIPTRMFSNLVLDDYYPAKNFVLKLKEINYEI